jgi:hypothetical protein
MPHLNQYLLSNPHLIQPVSQALAEQFLLVHQKLNLEDTLRTKTYVLWQRKRYYWTDQVFLGYWERIQQRRTGDHKDQWMPTLLHQAARYYLSPDERQFSVKNQRFGDWQTWLSDLSGLPVMAAWLQKNLPPAIIQDAYSLRGYLRHNMGARPLLSPYHPLVEDYIQQEGLHESHMHLNGTTLFELLWHTALVSPRKFIEEMKKQAETQKVKLMYAAYDNSSPESLYKHLLLARHVREYLLSCLDQENQNKFSCELFLQHLQGNHILEPETPFYTFEDCHFGHEPEIWGHIYELTWQTQILNRLHTSPNTKIDLAYMLYMLCTNNIYRYFVQHTDQYGFDQFQKFADMGAREHPEKEYYQRCVQLHGSNIKGRPDLGTLEGRFAPKPTFEKTLNLINGILKGFLKYAEGEQPIDHHCDLNELARRAHQIQRPKLRLVAHFIKKPAPKTDTVFFGTLRRGLEEQGEYLMKLLKEYPQLRSIVTGIDAAANEQEAPPEVFGALYRYCRRNHMQHFTYHAGEDFDHLISGIRAVYDVMNLLNYGQGDRIGHATSVGIDPEFWLKCVPERIFMRKMDWLNNLLFIRKIMLDECKVPLSEAWLEAEIQRYAQMIYKDCPFRTQQIQQNSPRIHQHSVCLESLQKAWELRGMRPDVVAAMIADRTFELTGDQALECTVLQEILVSNFKSKDKWSELPALHYLHAYLSNSDVIKRGQEKFELELKPDQGVQHINTDVMLHIQQYVQKEIFNRRVIIETLPTSNIRISFYEHIRQHHVFRWLKLPQYTKEGDSNLLVCLGSDDPGIFATDMRNEFYHLFMVMTHELGLSDTEAMHYLKCLNENGRVYRFDYDHFSGDWNLPPTGLGEK